MTNDMDEWQPGGVILYTEAHHIPRLKIITREHTYEIQACKFHPIMQKFAILIDKKFQASVYDSLERLLILDEVSKSDRCSEREQLLANQVEELKEQISVIMREKEKLERDKNDMSVIIFDGV
jgi:uncharacterized protein YlxW (UPF0749 family)